LWWHFVFIITAQSLYGGQPPQYMPPQVQGQMPQGQGQMPMQSQAQMPPQVQGQMALGQVPQGQGQMPQMVAAPPPGGYVPPAVSTQSFSR